MLGILTADLFVDYYLGFYPVEETGDPFRGYVGAAREQLGITRIETIEERQLSQYLQVLLIANAEYNKCIKILH